MAENKLFCRLLAKRLVILSSETSSQGPIDQGFGFIMFRDDIKKPIYQFTYSAYIRYDHCNLVI